MSLLKKISVSLFVALLTVGLVPFGTLAAETGTVTISVQDEHGDAFSGDWYLHRGTTINGYLVRNGSSGEMFQVESGYYFLEVRNIPGDGPYYLVHSDNPQMVEAGASETFNVEYFETAEAHAIASGNPPPPQVISTTTTGPVLPDVFDSHGCNSTQQFVWCERSDACVRYWTPACRVDETEEDEEVPEDTTEAPVVAIINPASYRSVPSFTMAPTTTGSEVPDFDTAPPSFDPTVPEEESLALPLQLAQTGPAAALLLIPSMLIGLAVTRRRG